MDLIQLQRDIKNKELKPFYIFSGEELELQKIYLDKIGKYIEYICSCLYIIIKVLKSI